MPSNKDRHSCQTFKWFPQYAGFICQHGYEKSYLEHYKSEVQHIPPPPPVLHFVYKPGDIPESRRV